MTDAQPVPEGELPPALAQLQEVVNSTDPFRVVIRGFAMIDELLDEMISEAFEGGTPRELGRLRLPAKLALARALSILPSELAGIIQALGKIRHRLAHKVDDTISDSEVGPLYERLKPRFPEDSRVALEKLELSTLSMLRIVIMSVYAWAREAAREAHERRVENAAALDSWRRGADVALRSLLGAIQVPQELQPENGSDSD